MGMLLLLNGPSRGLLKWPWASLGLAAIFGAMWILNSLLSYEAIAFLNPLITKNFMHLVLNLIGFLIIAPHLELRLGHWTFLRSFLGIYALMVLSDWFFLGLLNEMPSAGTAPLIILLAAASGCFKLKPWRIWSAHHVEPIISVPSAALFLATLWFLEFSSLAGLQTFDSSMGRAHFTYVLITFFIYSRHSRKRPLPQHLNQLQENDRSPVTTFSIERHYQHVKNNFQANPLNLEPLEAFIWRLLSRPGQFAQIRDQNGDVVDSMLAWIIKNHFDRDRSDKVEDLFSQGATVFSPESFLKFLCLQDGLSIFRFFQKKDVFFLAFFILIGLSNKQISEKSQRFIVDTAESLMYRELQKSRSDNLALERIKAQILELSTMAKDPMMVGMMNDQILHFSKDLSA